MIVAIYLHERGIKNENKPVIYEQFIKIGEIIDGKKYNYRKSLLHGFSF